MVLVLEHLYKKTIFFAVAASRPPLMGALPSLPRVIWKVDEWGVYSVNALGGLMSVSFSLWASVSPSLKEQVFFSFSGVVSLGNF